MPADVARQTYPFTLPDLPYAYEALEPHIDAATMRIHHREHHATYVKKLNEAVAKDADSQKHTLEKLLNGIDKVPETIRTAVKNNGGGHLNHHLFWQSMAPAKSAPRGALGDALKAQFGSIDAFRKKFGDAAANHFASGWVALSLARASKKLAIVELKDHEVLHSGDAAILILDVWEHAYYLKFQNRRPEFIEAFWNVVDWDRAAARFEQGSASSGV
ncbi:MAG TPA: superoxide dismutase [Steroidobacteraceae bacterium]|nr:superoxide dismutase [Steroidobacteraceae bacterium]